MGKLIKQVWKEDIWLKLLTIVSILLIVIAFFIPPMAVIDSSVLAATGILAGLGALWELDTAIDKHLNAKIKIKDIELEITRQKGELTDGEIYNDDETT